MYGSYSGRIFLLRRLPTGLIFVIKNGILLFTFGWLAYLQFYTKIRASLEGHFSKVNALAVAIITFASFLVTAAASWVTQITDIDLRLLRLRRWMVTILTANCKAESFKRSVARFVFNIPLLQGHIRHDVQDKFIHSVFETLMDETKHGARFLVEGKSSSGKTSAILILIRKIATHTTICKYADSLYYFDLAQPSVEQHDLFHRLEAGEFKGKIVIIDNFHRINRDTLRNYTRHFLNPNCATDVCSIFLSHPTSGLAANPETDITLVKKIKEEGRHFELHGLSSFSGYTQIKEASFLDEAHEEVQRLHLISMCDNKMAASRFKSILTKQETGSNFGQRGKNRAALLALVVALCLFRGGFSKSEFISSLRALRKKGALSYWHCIAIRLGLAEYVRCGIIFKVVTNQTFYVLHADLARSIRKVYLNEPAFEYFFQFILSHLADNAMINNRVLDSWLYALENSQPAVSSITSDHLFSLALMSGQYQYMLDSLSQITESKSGEAYSRELGVLCELVGKRQEAQLYFDRAIDKHQSEELSTLLKFNCLEHEHTTGLPTLLAWLETQTHSSNRLFCLLARFWIIHINIHLGQFMTGDLWQVVEELVDDYEKINETMPYEKSHLLRRAYFDLFRMAYLCGDCEDQIISRLKGHKALHYLAETHPLFHAYKKKTLDANYGHYCTIYNTQFGKYKEAYTGQSVAAHSHDIHELIDFILEQYSSAVKEFEYLGDKASNSLKLRIAEVKLMRCDGNTDAILAEIDEYDQYAHRVGIKDFIGNARSIMAKGYYHKAQAALLHDLAQHDYAVEKSLQHLATAKASYSSVGNRYGVSRSELLYDLLSAQVTSDAGSFERKWVPQLESLRAMNMHREADLIKFISIAGISPNLVGLIFTYYPIVIQ